MSTTSDIRKKAMEHLKQNGVLIRKEFVQKLKDEGLNFNEGHVSGALNALSTPPSPVTRTESGTYEIEKSYVTGNASHSNDAETIKNQVNDVIDTAINSLSQLAKVDLLHLSDDALDTAKKIPVLIRTIAAHKL
ncbi:hypothetical protein [Paenibacillus sp. FSL E2-0151]|uniref:hypothetical protein n=1 Tax=Paenibacillus sp. FSL E2-0151 TaxID=2921357 RepID=UPI0030EF9A23